MVNIIHLEKGNKISYSYWGAAEIGAADDAAVCGGGGGIDSLPSPSQQFLSRGIFFSFLLFLIALLKKSQEAKIYL